MHAEQMYIYRRNVRDIKLEQIPYSECVRIIRFRSSVCYPKNEISDYFYLLFIYTFFLIPVLIPTSASPNPVSDLGDYNP